MASRALKTDVQQAVDGGPHTWREPDRFRIIVAGSNYPAQGTETDKFEMSEVPDRSDQSVFDSSGINTAHGLFLYRINPLQSPGDWSSASTMLTTPNVDDDKPPKSMPSTLTHSFGSYYPSPTSTDFELVPGAGAEQCFSSPPPLYRQNSFALTTAVGFDKSNNCFDPGTATSGFPLEDNRALDFTPIISPAPSPLVPDATLLPYVVEPNRSYPVSVSGICDDVLGEKEQGQCHTFGCGGSLSHQDGDQLSPIGRPGQTSPTAGVPPISLLFPLTLAPATGSGKGIVGGPKRSKRERGRMAATRYRLNTIRTMANLEEETHQNEKHNKSLRATFDQLRKEVLELESEILKQSDCNCPLMRGYVSAKAQRYIASIAEGAPGAAGESTWDSAQDGAGATWI
ncbi:hypothetical protein B0T14DRAFT_555635 [Immersiella caudata]|uniref:BZIP domain-containing protein n=1 Tax=Immersiella caudata TaxID=314043 RepID=A0AA39WSN4_9PEZI|nr:hypothetical protein B0T14DRAFT_555635 [Immersiella caudata]